jgi:N-acetylglucosamine malate deacetylase 2
VVVAHPDDEVIGAGAQLPRLRGMRVLHVTDGAPLDLWDARAAGFATAAEYARARRAETEAALALAGIPAMRISGLDIPDQQASASLSELARAIAGFLAEGHVRVVLTHAYEGGHPDHDATAFAVHAAAFLLARRGHPAPAIVEMAGYHAGPHGLSVHRFLPGTGAPETAITLDAEQRDLKQRMIECHRTQARTLAAFGVDQERFRPAPRYDFTAPPHAGPLWYDQFPWGVTGEEWRRRAAHSLADLGIEGGAPSSLSGGRSAAGKR